MNSLIIDLQQDIINEKDILSILRKALIISKELEINDFTNWINLELKGYGEDDIIPNYRIIECELRRDVTDGINLISNAPVENEDIEDIIEKLKQVPIKKSIPELKDICKLNEESVRITVAPQINNSLKKIIPAIEFYRLIPIFNLKNIIRQVENQLLDWCSELKNEGIKGENFIFTEEEKNMAKNIQNNIFISHSQIQVGNNNLQLNNIFPKADIQNNLDEMINILKKEDNIENEISVNIINNINIIKNEIEKKEPDIKKIDELSNLIKDLIQQIGTNIIANLLLNHIINIIIAINTFQLQLIN